MIAPIREETIAIKTARPSALMTKLKPRGIGTLKTTFSPAATAGKSAMEQRRETETRINERIFLAKAENFPRNGTMNAPITGVKTANRINVLLLIISSIFFLL